MKNDRRFDFGFDVFNSVCIVDLRSIYKKGDSFMNKRFLVIMIIALIALTSSVSAQYVSFADPDSTVHKDIYVYNSTGSLLGVYNTTSAGISIPTSDIVFVLKPQYSNPLDDPSTFLANAIGFIQTNVLTLVIIGMLGGLLFKRF
ncbi:MAG: hypothetical protein EHJ95_06135 [Methanobacteriota archaeon]|nr:MAG: hypothetical protein EHJ95_06135 [Euryarchaeota archaeon]